MSSSAGAGNDFDVGFNSAESWQTARDYAGLIGEIPSSFTTTVRTLMADNERLKGTYGPASKFLVLRMLRGPSLRAPVYYMIKEFQPDAANVSSNMRTEDMLQWVSPFELASIIGITYAYRRIKKICDESEWAYIAPILHRRQLVGTHVGYAIPNIGSMLGMAVGGLRTLAMALYLNYDKKGCSEYRRHLKIKRLPYDHHYEMGRWGCTSVQVGSVLIQILGLGVEFSSSLAQGLTPGVIPDRSNRGAYAASICNTWVEALLANGTAPDITHDGNFYPAKVALDKVIQRTNELRALENCSSWLDRGKDDINVETEPKAGAGAAAAELEGDIPSNFSPEELKEATEQIQDLLKE
jgi:hypothetical protein